MKKLLLLACLFTVSGCKYNSLLKIIDAAGIQVVNVGSPDKMQCLNMQISEWNNAVYSLNKADRVKVMELMKAKVTTITSSEDSQSQLISGVYSTFSHVTRWCTDSRCGYTVNATKPLMDERKFSGTKPAIKVTLNNGNLTFQAEKAVDLSIHKTYYTKLVEAYDQIETLENAIRDENVWNEPTANRDSVLCPKNISLQQLLAIIEG